MKRETRDWARSVHVICIRAKLHRPDDTYLEARGGKETRGYIGPEECLLREETT